MIALKPQRNPSLQGPTYRDQQTGAKENTLRPSLDVAPDGMWRGGIPGDLALVLWGKSRERGGGGGAVGFGDQPMQAWAPAWPTLPGWGVMESSRGLPRCCAPPPSLTSAEVPATQSGSGGTQSREGTCGLLGLCGTLSGWGEWSLACWNAGEPGQGVHPGHWRSPLSL